MRYSKRRLDSSANERCREEVIADQVTKKLMESFRPLRRPGTFSCPQLPTSMKRSSLRDRV